MTSPVAAKARHRARKRASAAHTDNIDRYALFVVDTGKRRRNKQSRRLWQAMSKHSYLLRTEHDVVSCFREASPRSIWFSFDSETLRPLANHIAVSRGEHRLFVFGTLPDATRHVLSAYFRHVIAAQDALEYLEDEELVEALIAPNRADLFIGGAVDPKEEAVVLYRGTIEPIVVPLAWFRSHREDGPKVDPTDFSIIDFGQTIRLGAFEAATDAILYEFDPDYRRRRKRDLIEADNSLGGSIRRLRLQRGVSRSDFPGVADKTIARIERGEIEHPQAQTLATIADRLGVNAADLGTY